MEQESFVEKREESISYHIFTVSATLVGVCFTVVGLLNISKALTKVQTLLDEFITITAIFFLVSCVLSYIAIRTMERKRRYKLEKIADGIFLFGLSLIVVICIFFALELF
jgi:fumarate reductase subunit D